MIVLAAGPGKLAPAAADDDDDGDGKLQHARGGQIRICKSWAYAKSECRAGAWNSKLARLDNKVWTCYSVVRTRVGCGEVRGA